MKVGAQFIAVTAMACCAAWTAPALAASGKFAALEAKLSDALAAYDRASLDRLWDDQLVFVFPNGTVSRKAERLKAQAPPADSTGPKLVATNDAVNVEYEDPHLAVVVVRSSWRFGDNAPDPFVATHIWIKRPEGWRLISAQVAEVKPTQPSH
jgi:hypothetical protein